MIALSLRSILIGTTQPERLREWYRATLAPEHVGDGPFDFGGFRLVIDGRTDIASRNPESDRLILNFNVDDFDAAVNDLAESGVEWIAPPEVRATGRFATFADPDGNYLQLVSLDH